MSLQSLFESIFDLRGKVKENDEERKILIDRNPKQIEVMNDLADVFDIVNNMKVKDIRGCIYNFLLV